MRYGILDRPPHCDVHQSGTVGNIGTQGCMFDNLIRRERSDSGKTIVPDLSHSWDIAKDGKTYTFHLRQGVQCHDGTDVTSADVKATIDRIAKPPAGVSIPRTPLFRAVSEINARDKYTVEFKLAAPRSINFMMSAFASGWNVIFSKKTLEENNYDLRRVLNIPGTGPFKTKRRVENEIWVMERNPNYWNKGLPYLDGMEVYHLLPFSPELGAAIKEAKSLLAAAGQSSMRPLDFMVRDLNHHKLFGQAIQAMLKEAGIQSDLRTVVESVWLGDPAAGNYDLAFGASFSTRPDPSNSFTPCYATAGPQN